MQATPPSVGEIRAAPDATHATRYDQDFTVTGNAAWRTFNLVPDLVNGSARAFSFIFVGAGLPDAYHIPTDAFFANIPAITTEAALKLRVTAEAAVYYRTLAAAYTDDAKRAAAAVVLATVRVSIRRAWGFDSRDMVATQSRNIGAVLSAAAELPADVGGFATVQQFADALAAVDAEWENQKDDFAPRAIQLGVDMPVCNGVTIVTTGMHHYVAPHKAICDTPFLQHVPADTTYPGGLTEEEAKDLICHKASHTVTNSRLVYLGRNREVKLKLGSIGHGAAAVRVPAEFPPEKAAGAMCTLIQKAAQSAKKANVAIDPAEAVALKAAVTKAIVEDPTADGMAAATAQVDSFKQARGADVAWCAGFMNSMFEGTNTARRSRSILDSYAIKGLVSEHFESHQEGYEHYVLYVKWQKAMAREGHLTGYGLFGADAPEAFVNPEKALEAKTAAASGSGK